MGAPLGYGSRVYWKDIFACKMRTHPSARRQREPGEFSAAEDAFGQFLGACTNGGRLLIYNWVIVGWRQGDSLEADRPHWRSLPSYIAVAGHR